MSVIYLSKREIKNYLRVKDACETLNHRVNNKPFKIKALLAELDLQYPTVIKYYRLWQKRDFVQICQKGES